MNDLCEALRDLQSTEERMLSTLLAVRGVTAATLHRGAIIGDRACAVDVRSSVSEWSLRLEGAPFSPSGRRSPRFMPSGAEYQLEIFDDDRFAFRIAARGERPSDTLRARINRTLPAIEKLLEAHRRFFALLPRERGFAVLQKGERPAFLDANARRWFDLPGLRGLLLAAGAPSHSVQLGVDARLRLLSGESEQAILAELRPIQPIMLAPEASLTPKQRQVAECAASGSTVGEIARSLTMAPDTVRTHLREIYRRLSVSSRVELSRALSDGGWLAAG